MATRHTRGEEGERPQPMTPVEDLPEGARRDSRESEPPVASAAEVTAAQLIINLANIIGILAGVIFGILGVFLVYLGSQEANSSINLFGAEITTTSVGVACIFIGAVTAIMTVRRTFKSLDVAIRR